MTSELSNYYQNISRGQWAMINPFACPCRGGWLLSEVDTWHQCPLHGQGVPHPEDESGRHVEFDHGTHMYRLAQDAYRTFRDMARKDGFKGNFKHACLKVMPDDKRTPRAWVDAAETVWGDQNYQAQEDRARRQGFSSALEQRMAEEAHWERQESEWN